MTTSLSPRAFARGVALAVPLALAACGPQAAFDDDAGSPEGFFGTPFAAAVVSFTPGPGGGYGEEKLPDVVLGPPHGEGEAAGNADDVLSLGHHGEIVLELGVMAVDGEGPDLLVFENPFVFLGGQVFSEPGAVSVSLDGETWATFPCARDEPAPNGCAGFRPVFAAEDPTDPDEVGGDAFDLADVGLASARYVRITDAALQRTGDDGTAGFDLDALAVVNASDE